MEDNKIGRENTTDAFQHQCVRRTLGIGCQQRVTSEEVRARVSTNNTSNELRGRRWNWTGHTLHTDHTAECVAAPG